MVDEQEKVVVEKVEGAEALSKEEDEEEEREARELNKWNQEHGTGSAGTSSLQTKEEWTEASKAAKAEQELAEGTSSTHTDLSACFLCAQPSTAECEFCHLVAVCGPQHAKLHRPEEFCFPFMVEQREGLGRFVVATRDIEALELVMWDNAAALGPRMGSPPVCLDCLKPLDGSYRCSQCQWPVCSKECEMGNAHKFECELLTNAAEKVEFPSFTETNDTYRAIAPLRLLKVKEKIPETWERLSYLMDHNTERRQDTQLWETYQCSVNKFLKSLDPGLTDVDIDRAVGLLWVNAFACSRGGGQAIFPTFSFMSHSCAPNCAHSVFPNKTLALQAKVRIPAGTEFTISYISPLQGLLKRRMKLRDKWFFDCTCARCLDPTELGSFTSALLCQACATPEAHMVSEFSQDATAPWKCVKCGFLLRAEEVNQAETKVAEAMQKIDNNSLAEFEMFLESVSLSLHPSHYLVILLKRHLVGLYSGCLDKLDIEDLERVKSYAEEVDAVYQIIDPGYQKERGTILRALCEVSKLLAKKYLTEGKETEEQFSVRVKKCCELFQESQKCMFVRLKKDPNYVSKYLVVARKDPVEIAS